MTGIVKSLVEIIKYDFSSAFNQKYGKDTSYTAKELQYETGPKL